MIVHARFHLLTGLAVLAMATSVGAQARSRTILSRQTIRGPGANSSVNTFRNYSTGVGGVGGRTRTSSVLRRSLTSGVSRSASIGGSRARGGGSPLQSNPLRVPPPGAGGATSPTGMNYRPIDGTVFRNVSDFATRAARVGGSSGRLSMGSHAYIEGFLPESQTTLADRDQPVTTFVNDQADADDKYQRYLAEGERALKEGRYGDAIGRFRLANDLIGDDPESLISLMHAHYFADISYGSAAFYLQKTLRVFPELPLTPLKPRAFFDDDQRYDLLLTKLREKADQTSVDADSGLMLAYFNWFEGDVEGTTAALRKAVEVAPHFEAEKVTRSAKTFWRAMVASGKVTGQLLPEDPDEALETAPQIPPTEDAPTGE